MSKFSFTDAYKRYQQLGKGQQAELRRAVSPDNIGMIPAFYRIFPGRKADAGLSRVVYFMPFVKHDPEEGSLGAQFAKGKTKVSEQRLFQVLRSESPNDLIHLRRLTQQVEPTVDWQKFGESLYFWGDGNKRRLLEEYFVNLYKQEGF